MLRVLSMTLMSFCLLASTLSPALAQDSSKRVLEVEENIDYFGFDFATHKDISLDQCKKSCLETNRCRAFTYNVKARFCFLKSDFAKSSPFDGAISGKIVEVMTEPDLGAAPRLTSIYGDWRSVALRKRDEIKRRAGEASQVGYEGHMDQGYNANGQGRFADAIHHFTLAAALDPSSAKSWIQLSFSSASFADTTKDRRKARWARDLALSSAILGYEASRTRSDRAIALSRLGRSMELASWYREALDAYTAALGLAENASDRAAYQRLREAHGFRMLSHNVNSDSTSPRVCVQFSEDLKGGSGDYSSFFRVNQKPPKALDVSKRQICVEGLDHGKSYQVDIREGLPAKNGERLLRHVNLDLYVRDRAAAMRFSGNHYVLPANGRHGLPLISVNSDLAKLNLYRVSERSLVNLLRSSQLLAQLEDWQISNLISSLGAPVWKGQLTITPEHNREVTTAIPIDDALPKREPGIYLMTAAPESHDLKNYPSVASQWFVISDIGLTSFSSQNNDPAGSSTGGLQVFARSLSSAEPLAGLTVRLVARNNEVLSEATSDDNGMVRFDTGLLRGKDGLAPAMITAQQEEGDFVFLDLTRAGFDLSDRGVAGRPSPQGVDVYAWTERGVYRPGEEVHISALARDAKVNAVSDLPLTFLVTRPDGVENARLIDQGKALGGYAVSLPLTSNAMHGTWRIAIHADVKKPALAEQSFLVEDFLPDRTAFTLSSDLKMIEPGKVATADIEGRYLYGAPAAGLTLEGEILVRESRKRAGFKDYLFGLEEEESTGRQRLSIDNSAPLDSEGLGKVSFLVDQLKSSTRPMLANLVVRMREGSGRPVERQLPLPIKPTGTMIGIKPLFDDAQVSENGNADFQLVAVSPEGNRVDLSEASWSLIKIERHYQWYKDGNRWRYESIDLETQIANGQTDLRAADPSNLSLPVEWGHYRLSVEGQRGIASSMDFHAGWQVAGGSIDSPDGLELALDKASYKAGETAKLKVTPRFAGKLLLAVGTDSIVETFMVDVPATGTEIPLEIKDDWGGGVYLLASLFRPANLEGKGKERNPSRAIGVQWLSIAPENRALKVEFDIEEINQPNGQMIVPIKVAGVSAGSEAYVTVALVDEGILNLTNHPSPDPVERYFGQRKLGIDIRDLYGRLIDGNLGAYGTLRSGGDGFGGGMKAKGDRPTQDLVAFFSGILKLDDNGEAEVAFDIPQFNGSARLMASAWNKKAIGHGVSDVIIREPIVIQTSLPRFLAPDDESQLLVELNNSDAPEGAYDIAIETSKTLKVDPAKAVSSIHLARDKRVALSVPIKAQAAGNGWVKINLTTKDTQDQSVSIKHELTLDIREGSLPITKVETVKLDAGSTLEINDELLTGYRQSSAKLSLSVAKPGLYDVPSILAQLNRYPYGCAEQITSKALPLLYAQDLADALPGDLAALSSKEIRARLQKSIAKLLSYQTSSGGFSLWGGGLDEPWLSAYATDFLSQAREAGFDVPGQPMKLALQSVRNRLAYQSDIKRDSASLAYGLYVLALNRMASMGDLRYYADTKLDDFTTPLARAQLGAALALYGDQNRAEMVFSSALHLARTQLKGRSADYAGGIGSLYRDLSAMAALAGDVKPALANLSAIRDLASKHYDPTRSTSTQEQAFMLLAARRDLKSAQSIRLNINGQPHEGSFSHSVGGDELLENLQISNRTNEELEARITTIAVPEKTLPAGGKGFVLSRSYHKLDGSPISVAEITQNERFVVVLSMRMERDLPTRLILSDLLPAGLEIENPRLLTSSDNKNFSWLSRSNASHVEFRHDRMIAAFDHRKGDGLDYTIAYSVRAVTPGRYLHPAAVVEDMYRPELSARTASGWMEIRSAGELQ